MGEHRAANEFWVIVVLWVDAGDVDEVIPGQIGEYGTEDVEVEVVSIHHRGRRRKPLSVAVDDA